MWVGDGVGGTRGGHQTVNLVKTEAEPTFNITVLWVAIEL